MATMSVITCIAAAVVHVRDGLPGVRLRVVALHRLADERAVVAADSEQGVAEHAHAGARSPGRHVAHLKENRGEYMASEFAMFTCRGRQE